MLTIKPVVISLFLFLVNVPAFSQMFVTVDKDTYELVEDVNYALYNNKKEVYKGVTLSDKPTTIKPDVVFDSIAFSRVDYETLGKAKKDIDSITFLTKKTFYLDELVIGSEDKKEILLGESNRFVKRRSAAISKELIQGLVFLNGTSQNYVLDKLAFYVEKVKVRTAYKVNFIQVDEVVENEAFYRVEPGEVIYATDTLYLNPKDKNKIEVTLPIDFNLPATKKMFVWIQLIGYYDENGNEVTPEKDEMTRLKFQMSNQTNYYAKMSDGGKKKVNGEHPLTDFFININRMYNYDYAHLFFTTPHKSFLVAPAIVLYAHKLEPKPVRVEGMQN
ncbi:hypothetical protein ACLI1A_15330 [Flavobacterium sp. RHBU_3]|uniref:hypothetical protein n=1 Tax=Flavobacterium sp. RHBU_3 TaxID=3391184 RepID=UPI0039846DA4